MFTYLTNQSPYTDESTREGSIANMCDNTSLYGTLRKELAMANPKKRRGKYYYYRVTWHESNGSQKDKPVPLRTESMVVARTRASEVEKHRSEIIELYNKGESYNFPWMNDDGILKIDYLNLEDAVNNWLQLRKSDGIADSTISRNRCSFASIMSVIRRNSKLTQVNSTAIGKYKKVMEQRGYSPHGININLRTLKTFLRWCERCGYITKIPYFSMVKTEKALPSYIADGDFEEIMKLKWLEQHYKLAFQFYRDTGCRLSEPFVGTLTGTVLIVPAKYSKSRVEKQIELDVEHIPIVLELQARYEFWKNKVNKPVFKYFKDKYSKMFKRCCKTVGIDRRFHDLRHTFAVRRYLMTRDIYQVMKEMGHSKISTTEIYSKFNDRRLETDFPILAGMYNKTAKIGGNGYPLMDTKVIYSS